ncbi:MAG: hypothetical protein AMJ41_01280 [candidate division Zixibacteria bacterium DG_27]|nr:MAG: hypothetical protein AMJ41_01280 [candidate division Zixibacteria bacterium DG_27]
MFRRIAPLLAITTLVCFVWLALSPVSYATPPKKSKKTEQVEKKKLTPQKEKVKRAPTPDKRKESAEKDKRLPEVKEDKAKERLKKLPSKDKVRSFQEEKKVKAREAYDYFQDKNGDGIDDRLKEKKTTEEKTSQKKDKSGP